MSFSSGRFLGDDRFAEYKRSSNYAYKKLSRLMDRQSLPKENAATIFDMKTAAESAAKKIQQDRTLSYDQRTEALKAIQFETENGIRETVGDKVLNKYKSNGGQWIQKIAPDSEPK